MRFLMKMESKSMNDFDNISKNFAICECVCARIISVFIFCASRFAYIMFHYPNNTKYDYDRETDRWKMEWARWKECDFKNQIVNDFFSVAVVVVVFVDAVNFG